MSILILAALFVVLPQYYHDIAFASPISTGLNTATTTGDLNTSSSGISSCDNIHHCRTFIGLVWSCLNTVFLCTWVTIHPKVPDQADISWLTAFRWRMTLLAGMLVSPEFFVVDSFGEWIRSCKVVKRILCKRYPMIEWTETHGMMVVMGGFELIKEDDETQTKIRLNQENFEESLEGYQVDFSTITEGVIMDKSKGDAIAKLLVILQTSWFTIQCIARVAESLPVTALELMTLGYTVFVSVIYFFWWNKPLAIQYPITLHAKPVMKGDNGEVISAERQTGTEVTDGNLNRDEPDTPRLIPLTSLSQDGGSEVISGIEGQIGAQMNGGDLNRQDPDIPLMPLRTNPSEDGESEAISAEGQTGAQMNDSDVNREDPNMMPLVPLRMSPSPPKAQIAHRLSWRVRFGYYFKLGHATPQVVRSSFLLLVLGTFGMIHCLGWNSHFPSPIEQLLWRISALAVTVLPFLLITSLEVETLNRVRLGLDLVQKIGVVIYICARMCLMSLAFLALPRLPLAAYQTPSWTSIIPHL